MRRIGNQERQARLGIRHRLAGPKAASPSEAAASVVALHATDPATVFLSVYARTAPVDVAMIEKALYEDRTLLRMLGMRRTMFVLPVEMAAMMQAACANAIAAQQRRRYVQLLSVGGAGTDIAWLRDVEDATAMALTARGEATGAQLSTDEPRLRTQVQLAEGKAYGSKQNITSWVLLLLAAEGRIVRGRPSGSWTSTQWRWSPVHAWLPDGIEELSPDVARAELVRRWLAAFGPGTVTDLRWWTGWTAAQVKQALATVGAVEVELEGATGLVLPDDLEPMAEPEPWVALLPALDPTPMGWSQRSWYLGPHTEALFDRTGNVGPTVWCDGRIVGGWAQQADGTVAYRLLEDIGSEATRHVDAAAADLAAWIGPARITPRFRTPLERELTAPR